MARPKKHTKDVEIGISAYDLEGPVEEISGSLIATYLSQGQPMDDPVLEYKPGWDNEGEFVIKGWRHMTEKEIARAEAKAKVDEASAKRKKEKAKAAERAEYERLKKKFEDEA